MKATTLFYYPMFIAILYCGYAPSILNAQSLIESSSDLGLTVGVQLGAMGSMTTGKARKGLDDVITNYEEAEIKYTSFSGKVSPKLSPVIGVTVSYQWKEKMSFTTGMLWQRRGYTLKISAEEKDPEYQFDQTYDYKEKYNVSTLEMPLSVGFSLSEKLKFTPGLILGFSLKNSSRIKFKTKKETIINGERSDKLSAGTTKEELDFADEPNGAFLGLGAELSYKVSPTMEIATAFQRVGPYAKLDYGKLSDFSLSLSLRYLLPAL